MARKNSSGLLALVTGMAAGAAAVFLSQKENREKTKKVLYKAEKKIAQASKEAQKNPQKFAKKVVKEVKKDAKKVVHKAKVAEKKAVKVVKKVKNSPVLQAVGKNH